MPKIRQILRNRHLHVALLTLACFLLASSGWLMWLYHLTTLAPAVSVDVLTMVVGYLMQAAGIGAFALVGRGQASERTRTNVTLSLLAYVVCLMPAALAPDLGSTLAFGYLANLVCGYAQGYYLTCLARHVDLRHRGIVYGSSYAAATLLGWLLSSIGGGALTRGLPGMLTCCMLALPAMLLTRQPLVEPSEGDDASASAQAPSPAAPERSLVLLAAITITLMSLTKNAGFGFPTTSLLSGVNLELSRLLYGIGLLAAGLASDRDRRLGALCCAAALVTPFLMLSLSGAAAPATVMWALGYLFFGFFSVFRVLLMADLAESSGNQLLAVMGLLLGRVGDASGTALYVALGDLPLALITVTSVLFACTIGLFFVLYQRLFGPVAQTAPSEHERFDRFAARHDLSAREREVLRLVLAEKTNAEIADELFVSESTVKFHVRNLLRKTGCRNRVEIMNAYAEQQQ